MNRFCNDKWSYRLALRSFCWLVVFASTSCTTLRVGSDFDRNANFSSYHTFTIMPRQHTGVHNPLVVSRTEDDIVQNLEAKGYRLATDPATADFAVDFTIGSQERTEISSYPVPYASPGWGAWGWGPGWWGYSYWGPQTDVRQIREGTLSIDVFDARTHRPIWHGWAKKQLSDRDIQQSAQPIRDAVDAILTQFPPTPP